jgi:hypothetical protein
MHQQRQDNRGEPAGEKEDYADPFEDGHGTTQREIITTSKLATKATIAATIAATAVDLPSPCARVISTDFILASIASCAAVFSGIRICWLKLSHSSPFSIIRVKVDISTP